MCQLNRGDPGWESITANAPPGPCGPGKAKHSCAHLTATALAVTLQNTMQPRFGCWAQGQSSQLKQMHRDRGRSVLKGG